MQPVATFWDRSPPKPKTPRFLSIALPITKSRKSFLPKTRVGNRTLSLPTAAGGDWQVECLFFALLPAEIRIQIYELLLEKGSSRSEEEQLQLYYSDRLKPKKASSNPHRFSFILVCKRLTAEILPIVYATKTFQLVGKDHNHKIGRTGLHLGSWKMNFKNSLRASVGKRRNSSMQPGKPACLANAGLVRRAVITNWDAHHLTLSWDQISLLLMPFSNLSVLEICLEFPWAFIHHRGGGASLDPIHAIITMSLGRPRANGHDSTLHQTSDPTLCKRAAQEQYERALGELPERFTDFFARNRARVWQSQWMELLQAQMLNVLEGINSGLLEGERSSREVAVQKVELRPMMRQRP